MYLQKRNRPNTGVANTSHVLGSHWHFQPRNQQWNNDFNRFVLKGWIKNKAVIVHENSHNSNLSLQFAQFLVDSPCSWWLKSSVINVYCGLQWKGLEWPIQLKKRDHFLNCLKVKSSLLKMLEQKASMVRQRSTDSSHICAVNIFYSIIMETTITIKHTTHSRLHDKKCICRTQQLVRTGRRWLDVQ